jgi:hypothetical protein
MSSAKTFSILTFASLLACFTGCDGSVSSTGGGGSGGQGTTMSTGTANTCSEYTTPPPSASPVTVRIVNNTKSNVYLGQQNAGCSSGPGYSIADASTKPLKPSRDACEFTCADEQKTSCACAADCAQPIVTLVAPGGHVDLTWQGSVFLSAMMPANCYADPNCTSSTCLVETAPPAGALTFGASAWTMATGCGVAPCMDCTPDASGTCIMNANTVGGTEIKGQATWSGGSQVEIDIQ